MRRGSFLTVFWTLLLAIPFTALAVSFAAYITEHLTQIILWMTNITQVSIDGGRGWLIELAVRWPEIAGMIVGQIIILVILIFARQELMGEQKSES